MTVHWRTLAGAGALVCGTLAGAQTPAPATGPAPQHITTTFSPQALPGDIIDLPQRDQLQVPLGPPGGTHSMHPAKVDDTPSPGYELALEAAQAAIASCREDGYSVGVAVTDSAGNLKAGLADDNGPLNRVYMATRKDVTVAAFGVSTLRLRESIATHPSLLDQVKPNMSLLPGGLPIMKGDRLVGAIAVSGASAHEEEKCGKAGIDKIADRLK